jgi:hypothetical protein
MTGIMPKRLGLLPIEVEVTLNGFIKTAKKSSIVPKGESTIKLDYVPEIEDYGVVPIKPEEGGTGTPPSKQPPVSTDTKADIERRRREATTFTSSRRFIKGINHEVSIAKKFGLEGFDVDVSTKANTSTGFLYDNSLSEHFDTIEEAIEYANEIIQGDKEYIKKVDAELAALEGAKPKRGRKPSAKQVKGTANSILNNVTIQEVPGVRTDVENRTDEYINKIESAKTAEEVREYKADAHIAHTKEPLSVDIDTVSKIANARISELENSTAVNNVKVGEIIISKVPIFEEEVNTPFRIKVITEDKIEIESEETGFVIQINPEELETKFGKMTEETLNATPSNVTDIDLENAVRSGENVENVLDNPDELKQAAADAKGQDKKSIRSKLKDNSKKC